MFVIGSLGSDLWPLQLTVTNGDVSIQRDRTDFNILLLYIVTDRRPLDVLPAVPSEFMNMKNENDLHPTLERGQAKALETEAFLSHRKLTAVSSSHSCMPPQQLS